MNMNSPKIREFTLEELTTPKPGYDTMNGFWWATRNGNPIGMCMVPTAKPDGPYGYHYPMANRNQKVAALINKSEPPLFIPIAFWPPSPGSRVVYREQDEYDRELEDN